MAVKHRRLPNGAYETVDNVDANLEAAATPISTEPVAGQVPYRRDLRQEQIARLVEAGDDPRTATMVVDRLNEIHGGEIPMALFDHYNTPEGNAALRQRIAESKAANSRMDEFERNYNAETGHPEYGYDAAGNAAKLGKVDIRKPDPSERHSARSVYGSNAARRRSHARGAYNSEMDYANYPSDYDYPEDANRPFGGSGDAGPTSEEKWAQAESERLAQNEAEVEKYGHGNERQITKDQAAARRERTYAEDKMRANPAVEEARIKRLAKAAGISMSEARASYEAGMKDRVEGEPITAAELRRGTQGLRDKATDRRLAEQKAARDNWRATAMLAGGSQNLNSGNRWIANSLVRMNPEDRDESLRYMLPGGELAAKVDAAHNEQLSALGLRVATGQGFQNQTPLTAVQAQLAQEQLAAERAKNRSADENVLGEKYAPGDNNWFPGWLGGGYDEFTIDEQQQMYDDLIAQGYTPADAQRAVDRQAQKRRATERQRWGS